MHNAHRSLTRWHPLVGKQPTTHTRTQQQQTITCNCLIRLHTNITARALSVPVILHANNSIRSHVFLCIACCALGFSSRACALAIHRVCDGLLLVCTLHAYTHAVRARSRRCCDRAARESLPGVHFARARTRVCHCCWLVCWLVRAQFCGSRMLTFPISILIIDDRV